MQITKPVRKVAEIAGREGERRAERPGPNLCVQGLTRVTAPRPRSYRKCTGIEAAAMTPPASVAVSVTAYVPLVV